MAVSLTKQPSKLLYTLFLVSFGLVRLPLWMVYFSIPQLRQNPQWTFKQAVGVRVIKEFLSWMSTVEKITPFDLGKGKEGERFIQIQPASSSRYIGPVDQDPQIKPVTIGGTWYPQTPSSAAEAGKVIIHFHGGAYVIGDGRTEDAGFAAKTLLANTPADHVFCPQYRLGSNPGGRFPAFLQDGITSLLYVSEKLGVPADKITISGDSAGGHLSLSLLRYIHDNRDAKLPSPFCALLWSPWVNPGDALRPGSFSESPHMRFDYLNEDFGAWGARTITPSTGTGITLSHPNIKLPGNAFATPTPLFFSTGECEMLFHDDVKLADEFKGIEGNKVGLEIEKGAVHDIILIGDKLGFVEEAKLAAKRAGLFMEDVERGRK